VFELTFADPPLTAEMMSQIVSTVVSWSAGRSPSRSDQDRMVERLFRHIQSGGATQQPSSVRASLDMRRAY